ncbi:MAG: hypothetical protein LBG72_01005 [Spirochaetaceae bacterium]|nr:hypothetical protein [Spirochaetaceae bacterium]
MLVLTTAVGTVWAAPKKPKDTTELLDHKGASFNTPEPPWVIAYVTEGGNVGVEQLPQYKNVYCFVYNYENADKDFAVAYANNANGPSEVAKMISSTVLADAKAKIAGVSAGGETAVSAAVEASAHAMSEASFTGLRKTGDWWRIVRNKKTKTQTAQAYVLYTIDKKNLDSQIAVNLQNIIDNNKELSAAARSIYLDLIKDIRGNGFNNR